jgi:uncharacterized protein YeeX (DUF496 family)
MRRKEKAARHVQDDQRRNRDETQGVLYVCHLVEIQHAFASLVALWP